MRISNLTHKTTYKIRALVVFLFCCGLMSGTFGQTVDFDISSPTTNDCTPKSFNFMDVSSGGVVLSRQWNLGSGVVANTNAQVGANFNTAGTYNITLTVNFQGGITRSATKQVVVHPKPTANFTANTTIGCGPLTVQFSDASTSPTGSITKWTWSIGEGMYTTSNPQHTFSTVGDHSVTLFVENEWGCRSDAKTDNQFVRVINRPSPSFTIANTASCDLPFTPVFTNTSTGEGTLTYSWNFGEGAAVSGSNPGHTYTTAGIYNVTLTATNGTNCDRTTSAQTIYVGKPATPTFTGPSDVCINNNAGFSLTGINTAWIERIEWNFGNGTQTSVGTSITHRYTTAGTYTVRANIRYRSGCEEALERTITVFPTPTVTLTAEPELFCSLPSTSTFTAVASPANPGYVYTWNFGNGQTQQGTGLGTVSHNYAQAGNYNVTVTVRDPSNPNAICNNASAQTRVRIAIPNIDIYRIVPENPCNPPSVVRFDIRWQNLITSSNNTRYIWNFGDGSPAVEVTANGTNNSIQHTYNRAGTFTATVTAISADGCQSTDQQQVTVIATCPPTPVGPINGGGFNDNGGACANYLSYTLTAHSVSGTTVRSWSIDGDSIAGARNSITHVFPGPGTYLITVYRTVTETGDIISGSRSIVVQEDPLVFNIAASPTAICPNAPVSFSMSGVNPERIQTYRWNFGDGSSIRTISNPQPPATQNSGATSYAYELNGNYTVSLSVTDRKGCITTAVNTVDILVNGPVADFVADTLSSCLNQFGVTFTQLATPIDPSSPIARWVWNMGDGTVATTTNGQPFEHIYSNTNYYRTYNVSLTVTDVNGCQSSRELKQEYIKLYNPQASLYASSPLRCGDYDVRLYSNSSAMGQPDAPGFKYTWLYGDGSAPYSTNSSSSPIHTYPGDGEYTVTLIVEDENGCRDTATTENYIRIVKPKADFEPGNSITECAPISLGFNNTSETFGQSASYSWDFGYSNTRSTLRNPQPVIYPIPNDYDVTLILNSMGCRDTITKQINVKGPRGVLHSQVFEGCAPLTIGMNVTGSNISQYAWDFNDGSVVIPSPTEHTTEHVYTIAGVYSPNIILTSPEGCAFTLSPPERITVDSLQVTKLLNDSVFCGNGVVNFSSTTALPGFSTITRQTWDFGDGTAFSGSTPPAHNYAPGNYIAQLITETRYGCIDTSTTNIAVGERPIVTMTAPDDVCAGTVVVFDVAAQLQSPDDAVANITWQVNNMPGHTGGTFENIFETAGTYTITALVETENGCDATVSQPLVVNPTPNPNLQPTQAAVCDGESIHLAASDGDRYSWYTLPETIRASTPSVEVTPQDDTWYYVTVSNNTGCEATDSVFVQVDDRIDLSHSENRIICVGDQVQLTASGNSTRFEWTPAEGLNAVNIANPMARPQQTTTYQVTAVSANSCPSETGHILVVVGPYPLLDIGERNLTLEGGTVYQFAPAVSADVETMIWQPAMGLDCTNCLRPRFTASESIDYTLAVTNEYNCTTTDTVSVRVICSKDAIYIPNAFTPNGDGLNDRFYIPGFGVEEIKSFTVFSRYGDVVYSQKDIPIGNKEYGWDGTINGKVVETTTVFVYTAEINCNGSIITKKGTVTLIR